jgi:YhcH/YjgK/YiaL family protein
MIVDSLANWKRHAGAHPLFEKAFEYLSRPDLAELPLEKEVVEEDRLIAISRLDEGRGREGSKLEVHDEFIDIQFSVTGDEVISWKPRAMCGEFAKPFDKAKDVGFYAEEPLVYVPVPEGHFGIFWPDEAHGPLAGSGTVRKVIMKVRV